MQVILLADVDDLGLRGDIVDVARGYARNYLLPRRLAESATPGRLAQVRRRDEQRARQEARTREQAQGIADTLSATILRFEVTAGPTGALFGSVTATNVVDELWRTRRIRVDRRKVDLAEPIKRIGRYGVPIDLFEDIRVEIQTHVVPEGGELPPEDEPPVAEEAPSADAEAVEGEAVTVPVAAEVAADAAAGPEPDSPEPGGADESPGEPPE
jgi:large subunit ribosomal protein L9